MVSSSWEIALDHKMDRLIQDVGDVKQRLTALEHKTVTHVDLRETRRWLIGFGVSVAVGAATLIPFLRGM